MMNAVPDETNLELLVNSTSVANNVAYGTSNGYQTVKSGSQQVVIEPSGSSTALLTQSISFCIRHRHHGDCFQFFLQHSSARARR